MEINFVALILLFIAIMTIYNGYHCITHDKNSAVDITLNCIQMVLGGLLIGIVYFAI